MPGLKVKLAEGEGFHACLRQPHLASFASLSRPLATNGTLRPSLNARALTGSNPIDSH